MLAYQFSKFLRRTSYVSNQVHNLVNQNYVIVWPVQNLVKDIDKGLVLEENNEIIFVSVSYIS